MHPGTWRQVKFHHLTAGVAVEGKVVLGARSETSDLVLDRKSSKTSTQSSRSDLAFKSKDVGSETSNMRGGHGSTGDGVSTAVEPGGQDRDTWSVDVDDAAVVGERGNTVRAVGSTNGVDSGFGGGRVVASISRIVTSGNSHENTSRYSVSSS